MTPYAEAVEGKAAALKTSRYDIWRHADGTSAANEIEADSLLRAESYWVSADIWQAIVESAYGLPLDFTISNVAPIDPIIPAPRGWIWMERPWPLPDGKLHWSKQAYREVGISDAVSGILWGGGQDDNGEVSLYFRTFHRASDPRLRGFLLPLYPSTHVLGRSIHAETERLREEMAAADAVGVHGSFETINLLRRVVFAFFLWVKQTIIVARAQPLERHAAKRVARAGLENTSLRVITLRRATREPSGSHSGEPIERDHRWLVGGHWRMQNYPATGRHEPIYILPYVKGPEDKPFKPSVKTVHAVIR